MTNEEALKVLDSWPEKAWSGEMLLIAREALREKVEREKANKPKRPSLEEIEGMLRSQGDGYPNGFNVAAADIIKALREKVVPALLKAETGCIEIEGSHFGKNNFDLLMEWASKLLRALGEEA